MVATSSLADSLRATMVSDLRQLATSQENYFADHSRYGQVLGKAGTANTVQLDPSPGVTVTLTYATANAWTARAVHAWLPGRSCVAFVGPVPATRKLRTAHEGRSATEETIAACDLN